jgi:hypothetical protein
MKLPALLRWTEATCQPKNFEDTMKRSLIAAALVLSACVPTTPVSVKPYQPSASDVARAESAIADLLRDPASMQTRRIVGYSAANGDRIICGEYNSRNGFGGYGGFSTFYVRLLASGGAKVVADDQDLIIAGYGCRQAASGVIDLPDQ